MAEYAIETKGLTVYYGRHRGIIDVDLRVAKGEIFGFLGPNGAGKTTTERVLLDIIRPTAGSARMLGLDCQKEGVQARAKVGYLPGELSFYDNMKANQFFQMYHSLQGDGTDATYWQSLAERLDLDTSRKIREFSRGNKQKVGIVLAFMNKPALLILDEPTSGLDPLVQQTVMDMIREARNAGTTVFFSSHNLPEVQAVCDRVGIIREGRLVATERIEDLMKQQLKRLRLSFSSMPPAAAFGQEGVTEIERDGQTVLLEVRDNLNAVLETAVTYHVTDIETESVSLEEVFLAYYGKGNGGNHA
ncbi:MAG TPA: ABC transporter ATP-binding protein [Anaerolineae bacterium]|nr:ABC transporter ATP-binding protein [Anaerolineae bacterium]